MKDFPVVVKVIINIILYIIYVLFASVVFSFMFPLAMQVFNQGVINPDYNMALYDKIAIFIAILVLLISLIFRKHFYVCVSDNDEQVIHIETPKKKVAASKKTSKKEEMQNDEDIKIYVEKEIK